MTPVFKPITVTITFLSLFCCFPCKQDVQEISRPAITGLSSVNTICLYLSLFQQVCMSLDSQFKFILSERLVVYEHAANFLLCAHCFQ